MTLNPTHNDLPAKTRGAIVTLLNARLADAIDLAGAMKHAHWNVKGPAFIALHELFDKLYAEQADYVDTIAERAVQLGGTAEGRLRPVAAASGLKPYPDVQGAAHVAALASMLAAFAKRVRADIDTSDAAGDKDTADMFTGISRGLDKALWFVEAHLA
jgi:starvation-inducible DNA-binding protein